MTMNEEKTEQKENGSFDIRKIRTLIDLHLHLDGAIDLPLVKKLAIRQQIPLPESDEELLAMIRVPEGCTDLNEFLKCFAFPCRLLQTAESLFEAAKGLTEELKAQGLIYAEIRFAPQKHCEKGLTQREAVEAVLRGIRETALPANLILCMMRGKGIEKENRETLSVAKEFFGRGVAAVDLAGAEALFPTADFEGLFREAAAMGLPFTIHAGEADGPESVRAALSFGARRIGHGVRSREDVNLLEELVRRQIPLEICPTSNLCTAVFPSYLLLPVRMFLDAGIRLTINTDDPAITGSSLAEEFQMLIDYNGATPQEIRQLLLNSADAAFADEALKEELRKKIRAEFAPYVKDETEETPDKTMEKTAAVFTADGEEADESALRREKAMANFREGYNCAQAVVLAFSDRFGMPAEALLKLASPFGGGMGRLRETCGAVSGALMVLGTAEGYSDPKDPAAKAALYKKVQELGLSFEAMHGSLSCRELLGLSVKHEDPVPTPRTAAFYTTRPCEKLIGDAAAMVAGILKAEENRKREE